MSVQIVLVRHGATDWNLQGRCQGATDRELHAVGIRQAEEIAAVLANESIHAVYASGLKRAQQTAWLISRPHNLPVIVEEDIRELDHGALEGLTFNEIKTRYPDFLQRWRTEPAEIQVPGGERLIDVVVSHNFPILGILCKVTGITLNQYRSFHLDPCGVTRINRKGEDDWQITHINGKDYSASEPRAATTRPPDPTP